jgi:hypothetical protein
MSEEDDDASPYDVGYRKPPRHAQFKKGQSGNPSGRPRKTSEPKVEGVIWLNDLVLREAGRPVTALVDGKPTTISTTQAVLRSQAMAAMKGDVRAQAAYLRRLGAAEAECRANIEKTSVIIDEFKQSWKATCASYAARNLPPPDRVPNPDDVQFDRAQGIIWILGPKNQLEASKWQQMELLVRDVSAEVERIESQSPLSLESMDLLPPLHLLLTYAKLFYPGESTRRSPDFSWEKWVTFHFPQLQCVLEDMEDVDCPAANKLVSNLRSSRFPTDGGRREL